MQGPDGYTPVQLEELLMLARDCGGEITTEAFLEQAEDSSSSLRSLLTWDDEEAAHRWRMREAEALMISFGYSAP